MSLKTICTGKRQSSFTLNSTESKLGYPTTVACPTLNTVEEELGIRPRVLDSWMACFPCHRAHLLLHRSRVHDDMCACRELDPLVGGSSAVLLLLELQEGLRDQKVALDSTCLLLSSSSTSRAPSQEKPGEIRFSVTSQISRGPHNPKQKPLSKSAGK